MLSHYETLVRQLEAKRRGRKGEIKLEDSPELWMYMNEWTKAVNVRYESGGNRVCVVRPDNSMTITFDHWHTQCTIKIIDALATSQAYMRSGHIWYGDLPTQGGVIEFDKDRRHVPPKEFVDLREAALSRLALVAFTPAQKLRLEMGVWLPKPAVTAKCKDYALGKIAADTLGDRDTYTCVKHPHAIVGQLLEDL